jgi:hypothetical protein
VIGRVIFDIEENEIVVLRVGTGGKFTKEGRNEK